MVSVALRVAYHQDESALSLLSRLAAINHIFTLAEFQQLLRINPAKIKNGDPDELLALFAMAGLSAEAAKRSQHTFLAPKRWRFSFGEVFATRVHTREFRFCPHCLREDIHRGADKLAAAPYHRLQWMIASFRTCPVHGVALDRVPNIQRRNMDFIGSIRHLIPRLADWPKPSQTRPSDFERYLSSRIINGTGDVPFPDSLGVNGLITACEALGLMADLGPIVRSADLTEDVLASATNRGFNVLAGGSAGLKDFLFSLQPKNEGARKSSIYKTWGHFFTTVKQYRGDDLEPVKTVLRDAIMARYPKKVGTVVLDEIVATRTVHTVQSAAKAAGIGPKALRKLLAHEPTLLEMNVDPSRAGSITDEVLNHVLRIVPRMMSNADLGQYLGLEGEQAKLLLVRGVIQKMPGLKFHYDRGSADQLLSSLENAATPCDTKPPGTWTMVEAISHHLSVVRMIDYIRAKRLKHVFVHRSAIGLKRILLDKNESSLMLHSKSKR